MPLSVPRWIERLLFLVGIVCLGVWGYAFVDARLYEMREEKRLEEALRQRSSSASTAPVAASASRPSPPSPSPTAPAAETDALESFQGASPVDPADLEEGDLIGRIKIPRVGVSALVLHGVGKKTLRRAVGHIPGTPLPQDRGNVGLAGHRDSFFRGLKDIRKDDTIELTTLDGTFDYKVDWTKIVPPQEVSVLADEGTSSLTLVTCYPFHYVGSAPQRFIVRARRVETVETETR